MADSRKWFSRDGSVARDVQQEQRWWFETLRFPAGLVSRDRKMPQLSGREPVVSTTCKPPSFDEIADVVAILPKWRATAPDGVPNEAFKAAPLVHGFPAGEPC